MKKMLRKISCLLAVVLMAGFAGCKDNKDKSSSSDSSNDPVQQTGSFIHFFQKSVNLTVGESYDLQVLSSSISEKIEWTTSNSEVATVDSGTVIALQPGRTNIIASLSEFDKAICEVTVSTGVTSVYSLTLSRQNLRLNVNESFVLNGEVRYGSEYISNANIIWSSSDASIATVDDKGTIQPLAYGNTDILATCVLTNGTIVEASCNLSVIENYKLKIAESESGVFVKPGEVFTVTPLLFDENGAMVAVDVAACVYGSENGGVVEANESGYKALASGKTQVYVEYRGIVAYCNVDVWGITAEDFSLVSGKEGTGVTQERNGTLVYTGVSGVSAENACGILASVWKNFVNTAIEYGYTTITMKVYAVEGIFMLYPNGVANTLFDVERGTTLYAGDVSFDNPYVGEKTLAECKDWQGIYVGMSGNGSISFEITVK